MISVSNISVSFAHKELFRDISLTIDRRDRIALVGKNGAGKTTLIKVIAGLAEPTSGRVVRSSDCRMGYLPQQMGHAKDKSVLEEALTVFPTWKSCTNEWTLSPWSFPEGMISNRKAIKD